MRIGNMTSTLGERMDPCEVVRRCAAAGFEVMDVNFFHLHHPYHPFYGDNWKQKVDEVRNEAEKCGVTFVQSHLPYRSLSVKYDVEMAKTPEGLAYFSKISQQAVEMSHMLGCAWGVIHPMDNPDAAMGDTEGHISHNLRIFDREIELAHKLGVGLAFENLYDITKRRRFGVKAAELKEFVDRCNSPLIGACWDVGHGHFTTDDQVGSILLLGKRIKALHIHDNNGKDDLHWTPFTGTVAWEKVMHALYEGGCEADLIFETGFSGMPDAVRDDGLRLLYHIGQHLVSLYK